MDVSFRSKLGIRRQSSRVVKISPLTFFLGDMDLLASDLSNWKVKGEIIAVFHGDAAFVVLNDDSYDANRRVQTGHPVKTGNPYGKLIAGLMDQGIQIELCGATAAANHWTNKDLLPGVKVNTNAMVRVTELEQKGFTLDSERLQPRLPIHA